MSSSPRALAGAVVLIVLAGCGNEAATPAPDRATVGEARALEQARSMLEPPPPADSSSSPQVEGEAPPGGGTVP